MAATRNKRGSVLLMAIGMLTIVAIMASTFLIVSTLDARERETVAKKEEADVDATSCLRFAQLALCMDKYADSNLPYRKLQSLFANDSIKRWKAFVDAPGKAGVDNRIDDWLSPVVADPNRPEQCARLDTIRTILIEPEGTGSTISVDTDGDGIRDSAAYRYSGESTDTSKDGFYAAVRIEDLCAKISVNTAGRPFADPAALSNNTRPDTISMCDVDLVRLLGEATFSNELHKVRCAGRGNVKLRDYYEGCAFRLLSPKTNFNPFEIGDEAFLLWNLPMRHVPPSHAGRLYEAIYPYLKTLTQMSPDGYPQGEQIKRLLTTFSCTTAVVRDPAPNFAEVQWLQDVLDDPDEQGDTKRLVYDRMLEMLKRLGIGGTVAAGTKGENIAANAEQKLMAAHFTANLWTYLSPDEGLGAFQVQDANFTVYGYEPSFVITEVFAKHHGGTPKKDADDNITDYGDDWAYGYAIEITNPLSQSVDMARRSWKLRILRGSTTQDVVVPTIASNPDDIGSLPKNAYNKVVLYSFNTGKDVDEKEFFGGLDTGSWRKDAKIDLTGAVGDVTVQLIETRTRRDATTINCVVDMFTTKADELGYSRVRKPDDKVLEDESTPTEPKTILLKRDDRAYVNEGSVRRPLTNYNVAFWSRTETGSPTLGQPNGITEADLTKYPAESACSGEKPQYGLGYRGGVREDNDADKKTTNRQTVRALDGLAELGGIYLCGPVSGTSEGALGFPQRIIRDKAVDIFKDSPSRGRLPFAPGGAEGVPNGGYGGGVYPDVPAGCLFQEFFTTLKRHVRKKEKGRIYGLLNVNTAPREALRCLPWPTKVLALGRSEGDSGEQAKKYYDVDPQVAVDCILAYRGDLSDEERGKLIPEAVTCADEMRGGQKVPGLRSSSQNIPAYLTPGEVALPLAAYMDKLIETNSSLTLDKARFHPDYVRCRNALYKAVGNCITTRSDTFGVYITIVYGHESGGTLVERQRWDYVAVLDRSSVLTAEDKPALILFTEVK